MESYRRMGTESVTVHIDTEVLNGWSVLLTQAALTDALHMSSPDRSESVKGTRRLESGT